MHVKHFDLDTLLQVDRETRAYMAGFFDGEGCVLIARRGVLKRNATQQVERVFSLTATIAQGSKEVLELYHNLFGGVLHVDERKRGGFSPRDYQIWEWYINGNLQVPVFLQFIRPFVRVKHEELDVALKFAETYKELSEDQREAMRQQMRTIRAERKQRMEMEDGG